MAEIESAPPRRSTTAMNMPKDIRLPLVRQLVENGYARVSASPLVRDEIDRVYDLAGEFFARPLAEKRRFAFPAFVEGYREIGQEYSRLPARPDLTESFSMWYRNRDREPIRRWDADCPLHAGIERCADALSELAAELFAAMAEHWSPGAPRLRFQKASYIQINYYEPAHHRRDLLQDAHEDGHLITLVRANAPGLEIKVGDRYIAPELADDEVLLMPGSLLTLMTGGIVPPLYHRVHNNRRTEPRCSLMFFVNPEIDQTLEPWIRNESNAGIDIIERAISAPNQFGLPTLVEGEAGLGRLADAVTTTD
jgi:isopenicillin N synthase-like dioxygenase